MAESAEEEVEAAGAVAESAEEVVGAEEVERGKMEV